MEFMQFVSSSEPDSDAVADADGAPADVQGLPHYATKSKNDGSVAMNKPEKKKRNRRKKKVAKGYEPPSDGPAHAFRLAEKKYKLYQGVKTDYSKVLDLSESGTNTPENRALIGKLEGRCYGDKPIYTIKGHPGFLVVPGAFSLAEQAQWIVFVVTKYMHARTNITSAPAKGSQIEPVDPESEEGLARLQWATLGAHFEWTSRTYVKTQDADFPPELIELARDTYEAVGAPFSPENGVAGTVNYYQPRRQMCGHIDDAEGDLSLPLVSISLGHSCVYLLGGPTYDMDPTAIFLRSGDLVIMSGESRRSVHGVPRIIEGSMPSGLAAHLRSLPDETLPLRLKDYVCDVRLNVNVRTGVFAQTNCETNDETNMNSL